MRLLNVPGSREAMEFKPILWLDVKKDEPFGVDVLMVQRWQRYEIR